MSIKQTLKWHTTLINLQKTEDDQFILAVFNRNDLRLIKYHKFLDFFYEFYGEKIISKKFIRKNMSAWTYFEFPYKGEK